jgi:hypothetical protein
MAGMSAGCMETPGYPGQGTHVGPGSFSGAGPWNVAVEQSCAVSVAGRRRVRLPGASVT